jgi:hypothetical protein
MLCLQRLRRKLREKCEGGGHSLVDFDATNNWGVVTRCMGSTRLVRLDRQCAWVGEFVEDGVGKANSCSVDMQLLSGGVDGPFGTDNV